MYYNSFKHTHSSFCIDFESVLEVHVGIPGEVELLEGLHAVSRSKGKGTSVSELPYDVDDTEQSDFLDTRLDFSGTLYMYCNSFKHTLIFLYRF